MTRMAMKVAALACVLLALACHGGGGHKGGGAAPGLTCGGMDASAADLVRFDCPASSGSPMAIRVMIGPTTSNDSYTVKFDVVFNSSVVDFAGPAIEGNFLNQDGNGTTFQAGKQSNDPGRLVVVVSRVGSVGGVGVASGEKTIITLPFMGMSTGTSALTFASAEAIDAAGAVIPAIQFGGPIDVTAP